MRFRTLISIVFVSTFLVYFSSFFNPFIWDDEQFIYKNEYVVSFSLSKIFTENTIAGAGLHSNYYRPLTTVSFALDHAVWGLHPFGFHLTNTLLHAVAAVLCIGVLYVFTKSRKFSFWLGVLFAVHPLQTEAVTYINSRGDSLSAVFALLSVLLMHLSLQQKKYQWKLYNITAEMPSWFIGFAAVGSYLCSIFSKEIGIASLVLIGLLLFEHTRRHGFSTASIRKHVSIFFIFFCICGGYLLLRATVLNFQNSFNFYQDDSLYSQNMGVRVLTFTRVLWTYWQLLIFPYPLHMERTQEVITSLRSPWPLPTLFFLVTIGAACCYVAYTRKNFLPLYGCVWFFGLLGPVSGIVPINGILYEHWLYLPSVGFFLFWAGWLQLAGKYVPRCIRSDKNIYTLSVWVSILCLITLRQNYLWGNAVRFYEYTLQYSNSSRLHNNLGMSYAQEGAYSKALKEYSEALRMGGDNPVMYHNIGNTYGAMGETEAAITQYEKALKLDPHFFYSYLPLYNAYLQEKRASDAAQIQREYLRRFSDSTPQ